MKKTLTKAERRAEVERLEAKWLSSSDRKRVAEGKKPKKKVQLPRGKERVQIVSGGRVNPK